MGILVIIDTGVLLNILDVPGNNERRFEIQATLKKHIAANDHLYLPMATILETGNHIADIKKNGDQRRKWGELFVKQIELALNGEAPWKVMPFPNPQTILEWLAEFPDLAMRQFGFSDASILKEWETLQERHPMSRVKIWATDSKWDSYDTGDRK
ncbi:MAG: hypothetical protein HQL93_11440 [Magnetococcales bacterium]|nr:hypothetical protein [Magnetococcales bacterium]